jgi:hypothetical protein
VARDVAARVRLNESFNGLLNRRYWPTPTCACIPSVADCQCVVAANGELTTTCVLPP